MTPDERIYSRVQKHDVVYIKNPLGAVIAGGQVKSTECFEVEHIEQVRQRCSGYPVFNEERFWKRMTDYKYCYIDV